MVQTFRRVMREGFLERGVQVDAEGWREEKGSGKVNCFCRDNCVPSTRRQRRQRQSSAGCWGATGGWVQEAGSVLGIERLGDRGRAGEMNWRLKPAGGVLNL